MDLIVTNKDIDVKNFAFILTPTLSERKCQDTLRGIAFQLTALCEEGLSYARILCTGVN